ncbi:hypothetical protein [Rhizobium leguminosarum]|uniref:hypothetical protein n=1 Tax=Rhizobium leguminosarum TaxID=384 RepID=UPI001C986231|nr:hypothetical protein [Rhizobium leguminosarum]MBY5700705.1 hypothetical protein [Rhizobium leguminosarum]
MNDPAMIAPRERVLMRQPAADYGVDLVTEHVKLVIGGELNLRKRRSHVGPPGSLILLAMKSSIALTVAIGRSLDQVSLRSKCTLHRSLRSLENMMGVLDRTCHRRFVESFRDQGDTSARRERNQLVDNTISLGRSRMY